MSEAEALVQSAETTARPLPLATAEAPAWTVGARRTRLSGLERRWTLGVMETMYPSGAVEGLPGAAEVDMLGFYEDYLARAPWLTRVGLRAMFFLLAFTPLFFVGVPLPLHRLSPAKRQRHLEKWANSGIYWIRELITLLKAVTIMGYCADPRVRRALGMRNS